MNRVFKVIWNRTKGCYVVVAETAKNMTKRSSLSVVFSKMLGITACAVMLTGVMMPTDVLGAPITRGTGATAENDGGIAVGERTNARGDYSVAMGTDATVGVGDPSESESQNGIAIGHNAKVTVNPATATPGITDKSGGIAIGHSAETRDINTIAIGTGTLGQGAQAVAIGRNANTIANNGVAIGNEAKVQSTNGFALGNNSRAGFNKANQLIGKDNDLAFGPNARAWGGTSMAFGNNAESGGGSAVAIGNKAYSMGDHGVALGTNAQSRGEEAPALGTNSTANGKYSVAVGRKSLASNEQDIAIGSGAQASGTNSLAVGSEAKATKNSSIAIGNGSESNGTSSAVIGSKNIVNSDDTYVWGTNNGTIDSKFSSVMGNNNHLDTTEEGAHIMGNNSTVSAKGSMALGNWAYATAMDSFVMGNNARVDQANSVALGTNSTTETVVSTPNATVNGVNKTFAGGTAQGTVSIGANNVAGVAGIKKYYRTITNLAAGRIDANSTDAINGSQLHAVKEEVERGLNFDANTGGTKNNKLGSKVTIKGDGSNINTAITQANGDTTINMTLGNTVTIGATNPVTINGTTGHVTGLQNKDWNVDSPVAVSGRAATEDQLKKVNDKVNTNKSAIDKNAGNIANNKNDIDKNKQDIADNKQNIAKNAGDIANNTQNINKNKQDISDINKTLEKGLNFAGDTGAVSNRKLGDTVTIKGGADAAKLSDNNIGVVSDGNGTLNVKLAKELQGLTSTTFTNGGNNTVINGDGMTINPAGGNKVSLTKDGLNNGGNKITNVANGTDPTDAVNKSQLDNATAKASTTVSQGSNITVTPSDNANGSKNYEVSLKDQVTLGKDAGKQVSFDGTNGTIKAGDKVTIDGKDGKIAAGKVAVDGKDGYVTGLENKDWDPDNITSGRAATEDQLQKSHKSLDNKINNLGDEITKKGMNFAGNTGEFHRDLGQKVTIKGEGTESDDKYSGENIKTVAENGNVTIKMAKDLKTDSLTTDKVKVGKNGQDGVSITGPNGADGTDGKVGITGKDGKDAVSMSGKDGVGHIGLTGKDGRNADITVGKGDPDLNGNEITRIKYQDENGKTHQVATKDDGMKYGGDSGSVIKKQLNEQVNVVGGITDANKLTSEDNLGVVSDGSNNLKVRMAKDLKGLETVTTKDADGNTTVMNGGGVTITPAGGNQVSLTKDGLDNGGNTISNVGPGVNGTDAVNVNQLKDATDGLSNAINAVAGETQRVGAHAAALSALKPIQYDPLEPTQVMAGIGNYRGETAAALGVAHYTAEDTMFHVGMSVGSHHNMVNAGVTRKFGTSDAKKAVPERYKGGPISSIYVLQDEVTALKAENARMQESLNELSSVKDDNARMQQRIDELSSVKEDNEQMKAQIALLMQQAGLTK